MLECLSLMPTSDCWLQFPANVDHQRDLWWLKQLSPCHPYGRPGLSSPHGSPRLCANLESKQRWEYCLCQMEALFLYLVIFDALPLPASQINTYKMLTRISIKPFSFKEVTVRTSSTWWFSWGSVGNTVVNQNVLWLREWRQNNCTWAVAPASSVV